MQRSEQLRGSVRQRWQLWLAAVMVLVSAAAYAGENATVAIKVDQVGYPTSASKIALVAGPAKIFMLKRASDGTSVFSGKLTAPAKDPFSGDTLQAADFSRVRTPGTYYLEVPGVGRSWAFAIAPDVYSRTYYLAMRAFYGQRCGVAVDMGPQFPGYSHGACHAKASFHASSGKEGEAGNHGGWHDAGDYGRYLPTSGISTGTLMWAWEMFSPGVKGISLQIPESGNGTPDLLNEARFNLEWMLTMQDADGGVWHKQTSENFIGFLMPQDDPLPSKIIGTGMQPFKSTCATADLAATAAIATRVFRSYDPKFADRNLEAARKAWTWTEANPNVTFKNPPGVATGEYGDTQCSDERLWAAAELWRTTGETAYQRYFLDNYASYLKLLDSPAAEGWAQLAPMGLWTYALAGRNDANHQVVEAIRKRTAAAAQQIVERTRRNPYRVSLVASDYVWGSNGVAASYGLQLLVANALAPNVQFLETARDNLHYLLGRNTFSLSWVTQVGANPYRHPHHRPSGGDKNVEPWPGLLSGGPNANRQDAVLQSLPELPPAKVYKDDQNSYASNEVAINWQATLVFLLAGQLPQ